MTSWGDDIDWSRDRCQHQQYREECAACLARLKTLPKNQCKGQGHIGRTHRTYKLSCEEFDALVQRSEGRCDLCGVITFWLVIDHDHDLGRWAVRGLLCSSCNFREYTYVGGTFQDYTANAFHRTLPPRG